MLANNSYQGWFKNVVLGTYLVTQGFMSLDSDKMKQQDAYLYALRLIYSFTVQKWNDLIKSESKNLLDIPKVTK